MNTNPNQQADAITTALQYLTDRIAVIESCIAPEELPDAPHGWRWNWRLEMAVCELRVVQAVIEGAVSRSTESA